MKGRYYSLFALIAVLLAACQPQPQTVDFIVLQLNDVYEIDALDNGKVGGMARVMTVKKELLEENPNLITVLSGDFLSPSLIANMKYVDTLNSNGEVSYDTIKIKGKQMVDVMNAMELDYVTFGNHEFDLNELDLRKRLDESEFTWISNNVFYVHDGGLIPFFKERPGLEETVPTYVVHSFRNAKGKKVRVGITGLTLPFNQKNYVHYENYYRTTQKVLDSLAPQSDVLLALTHLEQDSDRTFLERFPDFDLALGGHDHDHMRVEVGNNYFTKADANAKTVYIHRFSYDPESGALNISSELKEINEEIAFDPEIAKLVKKWNAIAETSMSDMGYDPAQVVLETEEVLDGKESSIRNHPTNLGIMTAKSMLLMDTIADLAFINSGSIRVDDELSGTVLVSDVWRIFPFGGPIVRNTFSGKDLRRILEVGLDTNKGEGGYFQTANVTYNGGDWYIKEQKLVDDEEYKAMLTKFVMDGNEANLNFLKELKSEDYSNPASFSINGSEIPNDIKDIFIYGAAKVEN